MSDFGSESYSKQKGRRWKGRRQDADDSTKWCQALRYFGAKTFASGLSLVAFQCATPNRGVTERKVQPACEYTPNKLTRGRDFMDNRTRVRTRSGCLPAHVNHFLGVFKGSMSAVHSLEGNEPVPLRFLRHLVHHHSCLLIEFQTHNKRGSAVGFFELYKIGALKY